MFPPFRENDAKEICLKMIELLDAGKMQLQFIAEQQSDERGGQGVMLGAMIAEGKNPCVRKIVLASSGLRYALSLPSDGALSQAVVAPPVVASQAIKTALAKNDAEIHLLTRQIQAGGDGTDCLKERRKTLTDESLAAVHDLYSFCCADGRTRSLKEICAERNYGKLPPTGTGDCAEVKMLNWAFAQALTPLSMAQVFYCTASSPDRAKKGQFFPPCDERCGIVLPAMTGLHVLYRDNDIVVVNKPSGLLSVPGRGPDKQDCVVSRVRRLYPFCMPYPAVHRLDMETSGLLVLAFNAESYKALSRQFQDGEVSKEYTALLDGVLARRHIAPHGQMELTFRLDVDNRPHQIWDSVYGKKAVTEWQIEGVQDYTAPDGIKRPCTRVTFMPHTGRTHQLRLASADSHGFGMPIIGDSLYGRCAAGERLMLHASYLRFRHPRTRRELAFRLPAPF